MGGGQPPGEGREPEGGQAAPGEEMGKKKRGSDAGWEWGERGQLSLKLSILTQQHSVLNKSNNLLNKILGLKIHILKD